MRISTILTETTGPRGDVYGDSNGLGVHLGNVRTIVILHNRRLVRSMHEDPLLSNISSLFVAGVGVCGVKAIVTRHGWVHNR